MAISQFTRENIGKPPIELHDVVVPRININGTAAAALYNQHVEAALAVEHAMDVMAQAYPHGRDYQTAPDGCLRRAQDQYAVRRAKLMAVYDELNHMRSSIYQQILDRNPRAD